MYFCLFPIEFVKQLNDHERH